MNPSPLTCLQADPCSENLSGVGQNCLPLAGLGHNNHLQARPFGPTHERVGIEHFCKVGGLVNVGSPFVQILEIKERLPVF